ncbi:hypothetical protein V462_05445 [Pantoea ananatis 15320]|nr:hypothetical protein L585_06625 [Pantoea ananatis BRT175]PKC39055.1 hypothetical protein V462_05445 [Pantoea ananatis 15320]PKC40875.1 hypothetical protein V461_19040 [Pantoea ananatis BRT98]
MGQIFIRWEKRRLIWLNKGDRASVFYLLPESDRVA